MFPRRTNEKHHNLIKITDLSEFQYCCRKLGYGGTELKVYIIKVLSLFDIFYDNTKFSTAWPSHQKTKDSTFKILSANKPTKSHFSACLRTSLYTGCTGLHLQGRAYRGQSHCRFPARMYYIKLWNCAHIFTHSVHTLFSYSWTLWGSQTWWLEGPTINQNVRSPNLCSTSPHYNFSPWGSFSSSYTTEAAATWFSYGKVWGAVRGTKGVATQVV